MAVWTTGVVDAVVVVAEPSAGLPRALERAVAVSQEHEVRLTVVALPSRWWTTSASVLSLYGVAPARPAAEEEIATVHDLARRVVPAEIALTLAACPEGRDAAIDGFTGPHTRTLLALSGPSWPARRRLLRRLAPR